MLSVLLVTIVLATLPPVDHVVRIETPYHDAVYTLQREFALDVIDAQDEFVKAYTSTEAVTRLRAAGWRVTILPDQLEARPGTDLLTYHTYTQSCSVLHALAVTYPDITKLDTIGFSYDNHPIPALLVTDNPAVEEPEPTVRLVGAHHGNEKPSTEIVLHVAEYLCAGYDVDPRVTGLVDNREFWLIPILNPDGHIADRRLNGNGTDLNRDYGYEWEVYEAPFTEPETRALRELSEERIPHVEYEYHTEARYVNYLWDNHPSDPADSAWIMALAQRYADSTYGSRTTELNPINGYDWYEVHGSCQDHMFGIYGCMATTIETQLPSTRPRIDSICVANRRAAMDMALLAGYGVNGTVADSLTGAPLFARVEFLEPERWQTWTDPPCGDFHRMVAPGTYTIRTTSNGYKPKTVTDIVVPDTGGIEVEIVLTRPVAEPLHHAQKAVSVRRVDDSHVYADWYLEALGAPDGGYYHLGSHQSEVTFDCVPPVSDRPADDITVHATGTYILSAANDWRGPWHMLGTASETHSFDLADVGLDSARYLQVMNSSGAALDGLTWRGPATGITAPVRAPFQPRLTVRPSPTRSRATIRVHAPPGSIGNSIVSIIDAGGRRVRLLEPGPDRTVIWNLNHQDGSRVAPGVYFCRLEAGQYSAFCKLVVER